LRTFPKGCAIIFGGSGGIGAKITRTVATASSDVAIVYRNPADRAAAIASQAEGVGGAASLHRAEATDGWAVRITIDAAIARHDRIDTVIRAAGPLVNQRYLASTPMDEWRHPFDVEVHVSSRGGAAGDPAHARARRRQLRHARLGGHD